jgi:hypothetical protein
VGCSSPSSLATSTCQRLVAVEQGLDGAAQEATDRAVGDDRLVDELEPDVALVEVGELADVADPVEGGGPAAGVRERHEPGVEVDVGLLPRQARVEVLPAPAAEVMARRGPDLGEPVARPDADRLPRLPRHVTVGEQVARVAVGHDAARRGLALQALVADDQAEAAARARGGPRPSRGARRGRWLRLGRRDLHDADRHGAAVGQVERAGQQVATEVLRRLPLADERQHARPRIGPDLAVGQAPWPAVRDVAHGIVLALGPRVVGADQVEPDRGADDVGAVGQVPVVLGAGVEQVAHRQVLEVLDRLDDAHGAQLP